MERTILHSDINCCYAAIEHLHHPELAGKPLAVGGDPESRHGIVLTADYIAKKHGVKTGMALWQAKQVCPDITFISPRMDLYLRFSRMAHEIYSEYTDLQEPYGIDESWLDVSASSSIKGDGYKIAEEISNRIAVYNVVIMQMSLINMRCNYNLTIITKGFTSKSFCNSVSLLRCDVILWIKRLNIVNSLNAPFTVRRQGSVKFLMRIIFIYHLHR